MKQAKNTKIHKLLNDSGKLFDWLIPQSANWKIVVLCLGTATTFWFFNALNKEYTTSINYPIVIEYPAEGLIELQDLPSRIRLNVDGGGWALLRKTWRFRVAPISISIDNPLETRFLTGTNLLERISQEIPDLRVNYVVQDTLWLYIDQEVERRFHLGVDTATYSLEEDFRQVSGITITPDTVWVTGPKSLIAQMEDTLWLSLSENDIDENYNEEVDLELNRADIVVPEPNQVNVRFEVARFLQEERTVQVRAINFPADSSAYAPDSVMQISYLTREDIAETITAADFTIMLDYNRLREADSTVEPLLIRRPEYIMNVTVTPERVKISYE